MVGMRQQYYVYLIRRPDGSPLYVGKGTGSRMEHHERAVRRGNGRSRVCKEIAGILSSGGKVTYHILYVTDDESDAYEHEAETIRKFRQDGLSLANVHPGGGAADLWTPFLRAKLSASIKKSWEDEGLRELQSRLKRGRPAHNKGKHWSEEVKEKIRLSTKEAMRRPEVALKVAEFNRSKNTSAVCLKISATLKKRWKKKRFRSRMLEILRPNLEKGRSSTAAIEKTREATLKRWKDPLFRARMTEIQSAASKKAWKRRFVECQQNKEA